MNLIKHTGSTAYCYYTNPDDGYLYRYLKKSDLDLGQIWYNHAPKFEIITNDELLNQLKSATKLNFNDRVWIKIEKYPFQLRIQELPKLIVKESLEFILDLTIANYSKSLYWDLHEGNILYWRDNGKLKTRLIDFNAYRSVNHDNNAYFLIKFIHLYRKYVLKLECGTSCSYSVIIKLNHNDQLSKWLKTIDIKKVDINTFKQLQQLLKTIQAKPTNSHWSDDYAKDLTAVRNNPKFINCIDLLKRAKCSTVLDIGTNKGYLLEFINQDFDFLMGIDNDPKCIELAYQNVQNDKIYFANLGIMDFLSDSRYSVINRYQADLVIALAVTHHFKNARYNPEVIAEIIAKLANKYILIEDIEDVSIYHKVFNNYKFKLLETINSYPISRKLSLFSR